MVESFGEQLRLALTPHELQQVTNRMNHDLQDGRGQYRHAPTYLTAERRRETGSSAQWPDTTTPARLSRKSVNKAPRCSTIDRLRHCLLDVPSS